MTNIIKDLFFALEPFQSGKWGAIKAALVAAGRSDLAKQITEWQSAVDTAIAGYHAQPSTPYRPIGSAPVDEPVILATTGGWVGEAVFGENAEEPSWRWVGEKGQMHPGFKPLGWMPLPPPITEPA